MINISDINKSSCEEGDELTGLAEVLLKNDNTFVIGSEAIFDTDTPNTQGTGDSVLLLYNTIADNNNIPPTDRPTTERDWHALFSNKCYKNEVCAKAWASLDLKHDIQPYLSKELSDFLEIGIPKRIIRLVVTTAIDNTLELMMRAICEEHSITLNVYNFKDQKVDQLAKFNNTPDNGQVSLVYLFGKMGDKSSNWNKDLIPFVFSENDALETIVDYFKYETDVKRKVINNIFFKRNVMAIGCRFDDWKFRFFWYSIRGDIKHLSNGTVAYTCADTKNDSLYRYLSRAEGPHVESDSRQFMKIMANMIASEELYGKIREKRWKESHGVFISYASEDLITASELFHFFVDKNGIKTWMDCSNLKPQDRYSEIIEKAIHRCDIFIPILSSQTKKDLSSLPPQTERYYMREWKYAHSEGKTIFPIVVGNYDVRSEYHNLFREMCGFEGDNDIDVKTINDKEKIVEVIKEILAEKNK